MSSDKNTEARETDFGSVQDAAMLFSDYAGIWAVCGGWAIDLFLGRVTRSHQDVDFVIPRKDQFVIREYLSSRGWTLEKALGGQLIPWPAGEWIDPPTHIIWCQKAGASPDFIEFIFDEVDNARFFYRREPSITCSREKMIISSPAGTPFLAPEIVLLNKSVRPEDPPATADFKKQFATTFIGLL